MKDDCYGTPGLQKAAKTVHCPTCKRVWELARKKCPICEGALIDGDLPKAKFNHALVIVRKGAGL